MIGLGASIKIVEVSKHAGTRIELVFDWVGEDRVMLDYKGTGIETLTSTWRAKDLEKMLRDFEEIHTTEFAFMFSSPTAKAVIEWLKFCRKTMSVFNPARELE